MYIVYFELSGSSKALKRQGYSGAFVTCFSPGNDIYDCIRQASLALENDGYEILTIDKVIRFESEEWDNDVLRLCEESKDKNEVIYDDFQVWGN